MQRLRRPAQWTEPDATVRQPAPGGEDLTTTLIPNRGRNETDALTRALINLTARGFRTHCSDPVSNELWLSEDQAERKQASGI